MNEATDSNGANGRDRAGRFTPGCAPGPGNPRVRRLSALQGAVRDAVDADGLRDVLRALHAAAVAGDVPAAGLLLSRVLGKPREEPSDGGVELADLDLATAAGAAAAAARLASAAAAGELDLPTAAGIANLVRGAAELGALRDLETRIEQLEQQRP